MITAQPQLTALAAFLSDTDAKVFVAACAAVPAAIGAWAGYQTARGKRTIAEIHAQFQNNGGSSGRDQWDRVEAKVDQLSADVAQVVEIVTSPKKENP